MKLCKINWKLSSTAILLVTVFCLFSGCSQRDYSNDIKLIKNRLDQLEKRLAEHEQHKEVKELKTKFAEDKDALEEQLRKLEKEYEKKSEKVETVNAQPQVKPAAPQKPITVAKKQYHIVTRGETLYSISRKYKVSVAELCRLNNLKPAQHVLIGQKLLISTGSKH